MPAETLVMDTETNRQLLWVSGFMPLPPGARIELGSLMDPPATDAIVMKTRIANADGARPLLVLEVMLRPPGEDLDLP